MCVCVCVCICCDISVVSTRSMGIDNMFPAVNGYEVFTVSVRVSSSIGENCESKGCKVKNP